MLYPRRGELHIWEHVCDVCVQVSQHCCGWQVEARLAPVSARRFDSALQDEVL
jgi:hypothetical protein